MGFPMNPRGSPMNSNGFLMNSHGFLNTHDTPTNGKYAPVTYFWQIVNCCSTFFYEISGFRWCTFGALLVNFWCTFGAVSKSPCFS